MSKFVDLAGRFFGRLRVVSYVGKNSRRQSMWACACDCGAAHVVLGYELTSGGTKSCGCGKVNAMRAVGLANATHGHTKRASRKAESKTYTSWRAMKQRCQNPDTNGYAYYGGRGVKVCDRWMDSFANFLADMGDRPDGTTLDRVDPQGDYEPSNCRWATPTEQTRNRRAVNGSADRHNTDV